MGGGIRKCVGQHSEIGIDTDNEVLYIGSGQMAAREFRQGVSVFVRVPWVYVCLHAYCSLLSLSSLSRYRLYFPGVLVGPSLVFADYRNLVNDRGFTAPASTTTSNGKDKPRGRLLPPGRKRVGYRKMLTGLAFLGIFVVFGGSNNFSVMVTPWFKEQSWGKRSVFDIFYTIPLTDPHS